MFINKAKGGEVMKKHRFLSFSVIVIAFGLVAAGWSPAQCEAKQKVIKWRVQDTFAAGIALSWSGEILAQTVKDIVQTTNYRLEFDYHYGSELFPMAETFEAARTGALDAAIGWPGFLKGLNSALVLFGSFPCSYTPEDFAIWYYYGGGRDLANEIYGKYNMKPFAAGGGGIEGGLWSRVEVKKPEDFKGLKIRCPGFSEDILTMVGATTMAISPDEIYLAMDRKVVDAGEFSFPCGDLSISLHEVAEYLIVPAWWQTSMITLLAVNTNTWNKLPDELKPLLEYATKVSYLISYAKWEYSNIEAVRTFQKAGTKITKLDNQTIEELEKQTAILAEQEAEKNPDFLKVAKSLYNFLKAYSEWKDMSKPYGQGKVHKYWPNFVDENAEYPWIKDKNDPRYFSIFETAGKK
jgi:TRAP-type mannitol/chloroaromatic compound transport system substrate-binding protein